MKKKCQNCGAEIEVRRWVKCPECGFITHFKVKKNGRIRKKTCHNPNSVFFKEEFLRNKGFLKA